MIRLLALLPFIFTMLASLSANWQVGAQEYGGGPIVFIKPVRAVIFEHRVHLGENLNCQSCHPEIFAKKAGEVEEKEDFTMAAFRQGKYCGRCHDGATAFSVDTDCTWCHIGVRGHKHLEEYELGIK
jgi:c(7)-type cytochrome triheme protein